MNTCNKNEPDDSSMMMLMFRYKKPVVPLKEVIEDYLPHLDISSAKQRAAKCRLPFPSFKIDGNKSEYFVKVSYIAMWLDSLQKESRRNWDEVN